ncbi:hypothetical protein BDV95DRAFT_602195 [Massariosphaeria phaeospora]|uniref:Uncharacterized protein n=1 Tax=Massariosphaeria phaeospora TaxID=100035 RepID=A0A7C8ICF7_9PLEO|nr:hypothetical protein BDV95DRAFT_602195 [Massariosphaeria phaeospora]
MGQQQIYSFGDMAYLSNEIHTTMRHGAIAKAMTPKITGGWHRWGRGNVTRTMSLSAQAVGHNVSENIRDATKALRQWYLRANSLRRGPFENIESVESVGQSYKLDSGPYNARQILAEVNTMFARLAKVWNLYSRGHTIQIEIDLRVPWQRVGKPGGKGERSPRRDLVLDRVPSNERRRLPTERHAFTTEPRSRVTNAEKEDEHNERARSKMTELHPSDADTTEAGSQFHGIDDHTSSYRPA